MRALRSRPISDNTDNESNEEGYNIKRKIAKKYLAEVSEENVDKSEDQVVKKKSKKSKKKHAKENTNSSAETVLQEIRVNTENSSENDHSKKRLKKKKSKKLKNSQDENILSTTAQSTEIETDQKSDNSIGNFIRPLKKKSKKGRKLQDEKHTPENSSENNEDSMQHVKKTKKLKKTQNENQSITILSTSTEIKEKSLKKRRHLRSTIACSPNFNNAVTSTLMKPTRKQLTELNVSEIEGNVASPRLNKLTRQKRMSERINLVNKHQETPIKNKTLDKIEDSSLLKSRKSSLGLSPKTKIGNETAILQRSFKSSRGSSLGVSSIFTADISGSFVKSKRSTSFKNSSVSNNSKIKQENKIPEILTNDDSPDIRKVQQNTFNKSESTSGEDTLKENSKNESLPSISPTNRRETFNLSKSKYLIDSSIITISDTPDKTTKRSTFDKTEVESDKTFDKSNRSTKSIKSDESTLTKDQNTNQTSTNSLTFGDSILENTVDIPETPEKPTNSFLKNDTYELEENTSGDWKVEKNDKIDESKTNNKIENKENQNEEINNSPSKIVSLSPKDQGIRKKWLKFPRHSLEAKQVLDQISSPKLQKKMNASLVQKMMNTPKELYNLQKPSVAPSNLSLHSKSFKKSPKTIKKSPMKSAKKTIGNSLKKSTSKRTVMPNFSLIHQKAFDKMENLKEYSERKQQRAQALLSSKKPESTRKSIKTTDTKTEPKAKSSRQLFNNDTHNRFGFKMTEYKPVFSAKPEKQIEIVKPVIKPSVFVRSDVVAIANKKVVTKSREDKRGILKGVRTNRRFELLMQMRNK